MLVARRGSLLLAGAVAVVLATLLTLVASLVASGGATGGATGADAERCARFSTQSQARERLVTGQGARVVVIGDSYSVGLGLRDPLDSWPSGLPGRVHVFGFSGSGFSANASPCGAVSYAARAPRALRGGADTVVVEGGLNDVDQPADAIRAGFRSLMVALRGRHVLVIGPARAPARAAGAARVDAILREESARADVSYLPMLSGSFSYLGDGLHLTPAGHQEFGALAAAAVAG